MPHQKPAFKKFSCESHGRLLITRTPLLNSLKELFVLLNFICPEIFVYYADLGSFLRKVETGGEEERSKKVVEAGEE